MAMTLKYLPFNIEKKTEKYESFRTSKLVGMFELDDVHRKQLFSGRFELSDQWNVGLIVGRSGTGKSTIAREIFGFTYLKEYSSKKAIIDEMPQEKTVEEITKTFTQVGFSSPPNWLKPYQVLSNGEKMRVDIAYQLLSDNKIIVFDEFTSVVDREVAHVVSHVVQKVIRKQNRKFIAVTCHYDVAEYLQPDWVFSTDEMRHIDVKKNKTFTSISDEYLEKSGESLLSITI